MCLGEERFDQADHKIGAYRNMVCIYVKEYLKVAAIVAAVGGVASRIFDSIYPVCYAEWIKHYETLDQDFIERFVREAAPITVAACWSVGIAVIISRAAYVFCCASQPFFSRHWQVVN
jgi:hypothetical protein